MNWILSLNNQKYISIYNMRYTKFILSFKVNTIADI